MMRCSGSRRPLAYPDLGLEGSSSLPRDVRTGWPHGWRRELAAGHCHLTPYLTPYSAATPDLPRTEPCCRWSISVRDGRLRSSATPLRTNLKTDRDRLAKVESTHARAWVRQAAAAGA